MAAAGVAIGFASLFFAMVSGYAAAKDEGSVGGTLAVVALILITISYAMVSP
jgi:hypothetical protein